MGQIIDITERKQAENALRESERRLRTLLDTVKLVAVSLDLNGYITYVNNFLIELTRWRRDELIGKNWFEILIPEEIKKSLQDNIHEKITEENTFSPYHENEIVTKTGERRLIAWNNTLLRNNEGEIIGTTSLGRDVTDRKIADAALKESESKFRTLASATYDWIYWLNPSGDFVDMLPIL